jgi:probable phosphoglycerate mutase
MLVRHGETEWSRAWRHTGRTDVPLTEDGRAAAGALAPALSTRSFALVLTSPLSRARETAALGGFPDATPDDDLVEWDYGAYEGRTSADIRAEVPGWYLWDDGVPGGEELAEIGTRVDRVIGRVLAADGDVLVFAHGHVLRVLGARWLDEPPAFGRHLALDPTTLSVLGWEHDRPVITQWNAPATALGPGDRRS